MGKERKHGFSSSSDEGDSEKKKTVSNKRMKTTTNPGEETDMSKMNNAQETIQQETVPKDQEEVDKAAGLNQEMATALYSAYELVKKSHELEMEECIREAANLEQILLQIGEKYTDDEKNTLQKTHDQLISYVKTLKQVSHLCQEEKRLTIALSAGNITPDDELQRLRQERLQLLSDDRAWSYKLKKDKVELNNMMYEVGKIANSKRN